MLKPEKDFNIYLPISRSSRSPGADLRHKPEKQKRDIKSSRTGTSEARTTACSVRSSISLDAPKFAIPLLKYKSKLSKKQAKEKDLYATNASEKLRSEIKRLKANIEAAKREKEDAKKVNRLLVAKLYSLSKVAWQ